MGYHYYMSNGNVYAVITYNSISDFAIVFSHELAELMTDPLGTGWMALSGSQYIEIGDICETQTSTYVPYATATFGNSQLQYISKLWSNYDSTCSVSTAYSPTGTYPAVCTTVQTNSWIWVPNYGAIFTLSFLLSILLTIMWIVLFE